MRWRGDKVTVPAWLVQHTAPGWHTLETGGAEVGSDPRSRCGGGQWPEAGLGPGRVLRTELQRSVNSPA